MAISSLLADKGPEGDDAPQQGTHGGQAQGPTGERVGDVQEGVRQPVAPLADVVQLPDQFQDGEEGEQYQQDQQPAERQAGDYVAVK